MRAIWPGLAAILLSLPASAQIPGPAVPTGQGVNIHFTDAKPGEMEMLAKAGFDGILLSWPRYIADMRHFREQTYPLLEQAGLR